MLAILSDYDKVMLFTKYYSNNNAIIFIQLYQFSDIRLS